MPDWEADGLRLAGNIKRIATRMAGEAPNRAPINIDRTKKRGVRHDGEA